MGKYIVTDLTRFTNPNIVCTAVIDIDTGQCLRPMPYLESGLVQELNIHPGAILEGEIVLNPNSVNPHVEDASIDVDNVKYVGPASGDEFKEILDTTLSESISSGFAVQFAPKQKHIPAEQQAVCSIITVKVEPRNTEIHEDRHKPGKIRASFIDGAGHSLDYLSITDRGFFDYAGNHQDDGKLDNVAEFVRSQEEVYLRIGLSRQYRSRDGRDGYWLQVNGIYTFPNFLREVRRY